MQLAARCLSIAEASFSLLTVGALSDLSGAAWEMTSSVMGTEVTVAQGDAVDFTSGEADVEVSAIGCTYFLSIISNASFVLGYLYLKLSDIIKMT